MRKALHIVLLLFISVFAFGQDEHADPVASNGIIDLRGVDLNNKSIPLNGQWEIYWKKLYSPEQIQKLKRTPDAYYNVPSYWNDKEFDGKKNNGIGYATFRLVILSDTTQDALLSFYVPMTAQKVWFNGTLLGETGKVASSAKEAKPGLRFLTREVRLNKGANEMIVQVSNFHHRSGGFFVAPKIGGINALHRTNNLHLIFSVFLLGSIFIMALYHLGIFVLRKDNYLSLAFALFSLAAALRIFVTNEEILLTFFPNFPWDLKYRIEYFTFYVLGPLFIFYLYELTKDKFTKKLLYISSGFVVLFSVMLFFSPLFFTRQILFIQIFDILVIILLIVLIVRFLFQRVPGINILFFSLVFFLGTAVNDMLYFQNVLHTTVLVPLGVFVLILGQALVLAKVFSDSFTQNELLRKELEYKNVHLEDLVNQRTKEIEKQKKKLEFQNDLLKTQSESLEQKNKLIVSSLEYSATIQQALLPDKRILDKYFDNFILYKPKDIVSGDGYWYSDANPDYLFVAVYDCTGHGVPAAFLSIVGSFLLRLIVNEKKIIEPDKILEELDKRVKNNLVSQERRDGMDVVVSRIEKNKEIPEIKVSSARLNVFYYNARNSIVTRHKGAHRSVGYSTMKNQEAFTNIILKFNKGDAIYLMSDGFVDQNDKNRKRFGKENFQRLIQKVGKLPMYDQYKVLMETIVEFMADTEQRDDMLIIGLKNSKFVHPEKTSGRI